jgi:hypothetical protein
MPHQFPVAPANPNRLPVVPVLTIALQPILQRHILFVRP